MGYLHTHTHTLTFKHTLQNKTKTRKIHIKKGKTKRNGAVEPANYCMIEETFAHKLLYILKSKHTEHTHT